MSARLTLEGVVCLRDDRALFAPVNLALMPGECCELRGANGAGKSTLLRAIAGLFGSFDGLLNAEPLNYWGHRLALSGLLSVAENLHWYAALGDVAAAEADARIDTALHQVGLPGASTLLVNTLSQGQQRRVALARLLLSPQRLWLLDEPLTALDAAGQSLVRDLIQTFCASGGSVLAATHHALEVPGSRSLSL